MAHEFSHLANGDTKHFTAMSGWLHGLMLGQLAAFYVNKYYPILWFTVVAFGFTLAGTVGNVAGKIIQAGFSRSRERLADHTSVRFTRNPMALAAALKKNGGQARPKRTSVLRHPDFAHLYVSEPQSFL